MHSLVAPLFGDKHFMGLVFIAILFIFFLQIVNTRSNPNHHKSILVFMILFYILEFAKLGYIIYGDKSFPIYQLPLHLCSLPLYLYPLMYFFKNSKIVDSYIKPTAYSLVLIAGVMALAMPTNILGNANSWFPLKDNILPIISFVYHGLMIFSSIYLLKSHFYQFNVNGYPKTMIVGLIFAIIAMFFNDILDKDFMLLNKGTGSPLNFILDISKPLYVISMIGGFAILVGIVFFITNLAVANKPVQSTAKDTI